MKYPFIFLIIISISTGGRTQNKNMTGIFRYLNNRVVTYIEFSPDSTALIKTLSLESMKYESALTDSGFWRIKKDTLYLSLSSNPVNTKLPGSGNHQFVLFARNENEIYIHRNNKGKFRRNSLLFGEVKKFHRLSDKLIGEYENLKN